MAEPFVVLCMAGLYSRFRNAGYTTPKFLLPVGGEAILTLVIRELGATRLLLLANERDQTHGPDIEAAVRAAGCEDFELLFIPDTSGQAETAAVGARALTERSWGGPIVFHNIDTVVCGRSLDRIGQLLDESDGFIDVFPNDSAAYSYVAVDGDKVTRIAEKVVISEHATTGLYGFHSPQDYLAAAAATTDRSKGEFYISDVYKTLLDGGGDLRISHPSADERTIVLGTPSQYLAHLAEVEA